MDMQLHNLLEPPRLIRHFSLTPPEGFVCIGIDPPLFRARFDLLTTLEPRIRKRIDALPFARFWRRLFEVTATFAGTTVSEYVPLPAGQPPSSVLSLLLAGTDDPFLIVKDLPVEAVLVGTAAIGHAQRFAEACVAAGFTLMEGQALAYVPIDFGSIDEFLSRFSHSRRKTLRRKLRSRKQIEVEAIRAGDARFDSDDFIGEIHRLYRNVYEQSDVHFDFLTEDFFRSLLRDASCGGTLFCYRASGRFIGWNLCFAIEDRLIDKYVGFEYPAARDHDLYAVSWFHNLEYALEHGYGVYIAGWTDPEVKRQLGARFTPTMHAVRIRNPFLRLVLKCSKRWFEPDRRWYADVANSHS